MKPLQRRFAVSIILWASLLGATAFDARADAILDWNNRSEALITESKLGTPPAIRVMAFVQTAAYDAVNAITQRYPDAATMLAAPNASVDAAVAAAHRATLSKLLPAQQKSIDAAYEAALAGIADGPARAAGIAVGEKAAGGGAGDSARTKAVCRRSPIARMRRQARTCRPWRPQPGTGRSAGPGSWRAPRSSDPLRHRR